MAAGLAALILFLLWGCGVKMPPGTVLSPADVAGKRIGVPEGSAALSIAAEYGEAVPYADREQMMRDLTLGALDCVVAEAAAADDLAGQVRGVKTLEEPLTVRSFSFAVAKENPELTKAVNAALADLTADGTMETLTSPAISGGEPEPEDGAGAAPEGALTLRLAVSPDFPPYVYEDGAGNIAGLDIDLAGAVCARLGMGLEVVAVPADKVIQTVQYGKAELAAGGLTAGGEAAELVDFTEVYTTVTLKIIVRKA